jgi:putative endonuclease
MQALTMAEATRVKANRRGHRGEALAALSLRLKGWRIIAKRYRSPLGEIDLIARRGNLIAMVEVKARSSFRGAMDSVTPAAQKRIMGSADLWLSRQKDASKLSIRFDIIAVLPWRWPVHVERAFE